MTRSRLVASLVGIGLAGLTTLGVQGFSAGASAWPNGQALYYINTTNGDVSDGAARAAIQAGANAWSAQSDANFEFIYAGATTASSLSNDGQFNVFFRSDSNGSAIATSYRWWNGANEIVDSDIVFWDDSNTFFTGTSGCGGGAYIEDIAAHEFGHSLGLGHSSVSGATMYPSYSTCSQGMRTLSADDIAGVESLYPPSGSTQPPSAPSNLTAVTNSSDPDGKIDLAWNDTSHDEDGFVIERALDGVNFLFLAQNNANDSTYTDSNLSSGTTYWYRVKATNTGGESGLSNTASAVTESPAPPNPPNAPVSLTADLGANPENTIDLSWNDMSNDEDAFTIERSMNGSNFQAIGQNNANDTTYTDTNLSSGTTYWYRVMAVNQGGSSAASNVDSAQTSEPPPPPPPPDPVDPPSAPTNPSPANGATYVNRGADLAWSGDPAADSYNVYFGQSNPPPLHQSGVTSTSLNMSRLPKNKNFYWKVVAVNSGGSTSSAVWSFSTGAGATGGGSTSGGGGGPGKGKGKKK